LAAFEAWTVRRLDSIDDSATAREVELYLYWRQSRVLRLRAEAGPVSAQATNTARDQTDAAVRFLCSLADDRGKTLAEVDQADIDVWYSTASNPNGASDFLVFAMGRRRCRHVRIPNPGRRSSPGCPPKRLETIARRLLEDESVALADRVAGLLVVLLAQPVTRIAALQLHHVVDSEGDLSLRLGTDPVVLPVGTAVLVRRLHDEHATSDRTNERNGYLFPGGRPGQHLTAAMLTSRLNRLGITKTERQGALSRLTAEIPAAIVANATGYSLEASARRAAQGGTEWANYVNLKVAGSR
jgi:hypothetical protein